MTATEELRAMLNERGVEREEFKTCGGTVFYLDWNEWCGCYTKLVGVDGACCYAELEVLTPDQAVEVVLGRGECHVTREPGSDRLWYCDACGSYHEHASEYPWEYCPRCGAKVVS